MLQDVQNYRETILAAQEAPRTAWEALQDSSDPLIAFIATHASNYRDEALTIMEALPADAATLRTLAQARGWHAGTFTSLLNQAVAEGLIQESEGASSTATEAPASTGTPRQAALDYVRNNIGAHAIAQATRMINEIVADEAAAYVAAH